MSQGAQTLACLRVVCETNAAGYLADAGAEGLHVSDLAIKAGVESGKLARVLRLLASRHVFREGTHPFAPTVLLSYSDANHVQSRKMFLPITGYQFVFTQTTHLTASSVICLLFPLFPGRQPDLFIFLGPMSAPFRRLICTILSSTQQPALRMRRSSLRRLVHFP